MEPECAPSKPHAFLTPLCYVCVVLCRYTRADLHTQVHHKQAAKQHPRPRIVSCAATTLLWQERATKPGAAALRVFKCWQPCYKRRRGTVYQQQLRQQLPRQLSGKGPVRLQRRLQCGRQVLWRAGQRCLCTWHTPVSLHQPQQHCCQHGLQARCPSCQGPGSSSSRRHNAIRQSQRVRCHVGSVHAATTAVAAL